MELLTWLGGGPVKFKWAPRVTCSHGDLITFSAPKSILTRDVRTVVRREGGSEEISANIDTRLRYNEAYRTALVGKKHGVILARQK